MSVSSSTIKGATWFWRSLSSRGVVSANWEIKAAKSQDLSRKLWSICSTHADSGEIFFKNKWLWLTGIQPLVYTVNQKLPPFECLMSPFSKVDDGLNFQLESILQSWYLRKLQKTHYKMWQGLPSWCLTLLMTFHKNYPAFLPDHSHFP